MKFNGAITLAFAGVLMAGCSTGSAILDSVSSAGDRFTQLFGSNTQAPGEAASHEDTELYCPDVAIRDGTATLTSSVGGPGAPAGPGALRYQGTITRTARECVLSNGVTMNVKIGIQGRVIAGPAGAPPTVEVPLRVAVVQDGVQPKTVFSRFYKASVSMTEGNVPFSFVAEDVSYPAPRADQQANYVFYIGFDPQGLTQRPAPAKKKGR
jgi:hypothetical protein